MDETTSPKPHPQGHEDHGHGHGAVSHERRDVNVFQIVAFGVGLLVSCVVVVIAMWAMFHFLRQREDQKNPVLVESMQKRNLLPPEPRLQALPKVELKELVESEELILSSYGLLDPTKGIARIPIEQAIDILAAKGLPSKAASDGYRMMPLDSNSGRTLEKISQ